MMDKIYKEKITFALQQIEKNGGKVGEFLLVILENSVFRILQECTLILKSNWLCDQNLSEMSFAGEISDAEIT